MEFVKTDRAPAAVGPYSQAVRAGNWLFVSGQIALDPRTGKLEGDAAAQTERALQNLFEILKAAGFERESIVKVTIYTTEMENFSKINEVYERMMGNHRPARATVGVASLPLGAKVEIEAVAYKE